MKISSFFLSVFFLMILYSCKKEKTVIPKTNCTEKLPIKYFDILERVADTLLSTDAALISGSVTFKASEKYDSVKWTIGNDPRIFKEKQISLIFDTPEIINTTLIGFISKPYQCDGKLIDTISRKLEILPARNSFLSGKYKGIRVSNPTDSFIVEIKQVNEPTWYADYFIYNFPKGCNVRFPPYPNDAGYLISAGAKNFRMRNALPAIQECLFEIYGTGSLLHNNDSLMIDFSYRLVGNQPGRASDKFLGKKF